MKRFLIKVSIFCSLFFVFLGGVFWFTRNFSTVEVKKKSPILVLGHSHAECAYNDSIIDSVTNFAQSGESYFYTYFKSKLLVDQNPDIQTVLIEFTNNQLSNAKDLWIWNDDQIAYRYPKYGPFMDMDAYALLMKHNAMAVMRNSRLLFKNCLHSTFTAHNFPVEIGGYLHLVRDKTDSLLAVLPKSNESSRYVLSSDNLKYLRLMIDYLKSKHKTVFLIRSPLHIRTDSYTYEVQFNEVRQAQFGDVEFLDFSRFPITNEQFGDLEHLNFKGATVYSRWFNEMLSQGLLENDNKQQMIDEAIQKMSVMETSNAISSGL